MVSHLRKAFPSTIDANTVKRLGIAPNNESYVINVLQFIGVIDVEGNKTAKASNVFSNHKDEDFAEGFEELVKAAYTELFNLHGDGAWQLNKEELITFFRRTDETSATIGGRQASTFLVLAALSGHGEVPTKRDATKQQAKIGAKTAKETVKKASNSKQSPPATTATVSTLTERRTDIGLTVRVEVNLPSGGTKETYDNIFKSIRENLIDD